VDICNARQAAFDKSASGNMYTFILMRCGVFP
jgi:hypothetical protein